MGTSKKKNHGCLKQLHYNNTFPCRCYRKFAAKIHPHLLRCRFTAIGRTECVCHKKERWAKIIIFRREKQGKNTITKSMQMQL